MADQTKPSLDSVYVSGIDLTKIFQTDSKTIRKNYDTCKTEILRPISRKKFLDLRHSRLHANRYSPAAMRRIRNLSISYCAIGILLASTSSLLPSTILSSSINGLAVGLIINGSFYLNRCFRNSHKQFSRRHKKMLGRIDTIDRDLHDTITKGWEYNTELLSTARITDFLSCLGMKSNQFYNNRFNQLNEFLNIAFDNAFSRVRENPQLALERIEYLKGILKRLNEQLREKVEQDPQLTHLATQRASETVHKFSDMFSELSKQANTIHNYLNGTVALPEKEYAKIDFVDGAIVVTIYSDDGVYKGGFGSDIDNDISGGPAITPPNEPPSSLRQSSNLPAIPLGFNRTKQPRGKCDAIGIEPISL